MIHRFVDSVVLTSPPDGIPYMASSSGPVYEIWRGGLGTTPVKLTAATPGTVPGDVILSPDLFEAAYSAVNSGELQVRVVQMDDTNDELVVGHSVFNTNLTASPSWNPAGTKLVYIMGGASSGDPLTIRTINRDGSGETTLWTSTTSYGDPVYVKWSPSGDYIVWSIQRVLVGSPGVVADGG